MTTNTRHHTPEELLQRLEDLEIQVTTHHHKPIFTVEEGRDIEAKLPGLHSKNLFLRDKKKQYYLVSMIGEDRLNLKAFTKFLGLPSGSLSFASNDRLQELMGVEPGHVTVFAFINQSAHSVRCILDQDFFNDTPVYFHPLKNNMSTAIDPQDLLKFLQIIGITPEIVSLPKLD